MMVLKFERQNIAFPTKQFSNGAVKCLIWYGKNVTLWEGMGRKTNFQISFPTLNESRSDLSSVINLSMTWKPRLRKQNEKGDHVTLA